MKNILILLTLVSGLTTAQATETKTYGLHLFFNEQVFIDVLTLTKNDDGTITGHMFVPDDFQGDITNIVLTGNNIEFDLFVPKNAFRPNDLIFNYKGEFFDDKHAQLTGYVTLKDDTAFLASFVAFLR